MVWGAGMTGVWSLDRLNPFKSKSPVLEIGQARPWREKKDGECEIRLS